MTEATHTPDCASHGAIDLLPDECCDCGAVTQPDETWLPFDSAELAQAAGYTSGTLSNGDTFGDEDDPNPIHWLYDAKCEPELFRAEIERLLERVKELELDVRTQEMLQVGCYHAGMKFGWNCCDTRDSGGLDRFDAAMASTEHIAELKSIREARAVLQSSGK